MFESRRRSRTNESFLGVVVVVVVDIVVNVSSTPSKSAHTQIHALQTPQPPPPGQIAPAHVPPFFPASLDPSRPTSTTTATPNRRGVLSASFVCAYIRSRSFVVVPHRYGCRIFGYIFRKKHPPPAKKKEALKRNPPKSSRPHPLGPADEKP